MGERGEREEEKRKGYEELMYTEQLTATHLFSAISFHFHNNPTKWVLWYHKDRSPFRDSCPFPKKFWASNLFSYPTE